MQQDDYLVDEQGGEYRVVGGTEMRAVWVPLTAAEKQALVKKATGEGKAVGLLVAGFLKSYLKGEASAELSLEDLATVAGGTETYQRSSLWAGQLYPSLVRDGRLRFDAFNPQRIIDPGNLVASTVMCPW